MLVVGLTGSIGMGKSTAAAGFRKHGILVFDADQVVHDLYDGALVADIEAAFPGVTAHGKVDRAKLSQALIAKPEKFKALEAIVHPRVREMERAFLHGQAKRGATIAVLEIPLLYEGGAEKLCDAVVVVSADAKTQCARVLQRPGMTSEKFERILARQMTDKEKRSRADFVVDTNGTVDACHAQISQILAQLKGQTGSAFERSWQ